eukprot:8036688-Pyramimonas_sp.AAC.1
MRKVPRSFPPRAGCGFDALSPRQLDHLPDEAIRVLTQLVMDVEATCEWPLVHTRIVFLLKRTGGLRSIGLRFCAARIQGRFRRYLVRSWQGSNFRSFWWATAGRCSDILVWVQSAMTEWCQGRGFSSVLALLDLEKAFEQISHH